MLTFEVIIVFLGLIGMVTALLLDKMRPGMILFSPEAEVSLSTVPMLPIAGLLH